MTGGQIVTLQLQGGGDGAWRTLNNLVQHRQRRRR